MKNELITGLSLNCRGNPFVVARAYSMIFIRNNYPLQFLI